MNFGPLLGLAGALFASLSAFKWMLAAFVVVMIGWSIYSSRVSRNALDSRAIKDLIKSSAQWNLRSSQDSNAVVGLMNSNYAMAYLNVARSLGSDEEIEKTTNIKIDAFVNEIESFQSNAISRITGACPSLLGGLPLDATGWKKAK